MRWILGLVVMVCTGLMGRILAGSVRERPRQLAVLQASLARMETSICHGMMFLPEALEELAGVTPGPVRYLFLEAAHLLVQEELPMALAWRRAILAARGYLVFTRDDERVLLMLGNSLGISPRDDQIRHLTAAKSQLARLEAEAREKEQHLARLYHALGWAAGVILILILI
ncbi:MAG: hypothetical protein GX316_06580 [Firmicutes bacterium]|nr:hypothetical protein [Bacillota bacterium]